MSRHLLLEKLAMRKHLVFLLCAPIGSFGGYAGHERRGSGLFPLRSAVLGLIGAAIGIKRSDKVGQESLRSYSVAVKPFHESRPLRDYHTVQTVPTSKAKRPSSRGQAMARAGRDINTTITVRDYRCDVVMGSVIWGHGPWELEDISDHLRRPTYPLYLGRKSCPLSSPLNPIIRMAKGPVEALKVIEIPEWNVSRQTQPENLERFPVYSDPVEGYVSPTLVERVPGEPLDRETWTFSECEVWQFWSDKANHKENGDKI